MRLLCAIGVDAGDQFRDQRRAEVAIEGTIGRCFLRIMGAQRFAHVVLHGVGVVAGKIRAARLPGGKYEVVHALAQRCRILFLPEGAVCQFVHIPGDARALFRCPTALFQQFVELMGGAAFIVVLADQVDEVAHRAVGGEEGNEILVGLFQRLRVLFFIDLRRHGQRSARNAARAEIGDVFMGDGIDGDRHADAVEAVSYTHLDVYKRQRWRWG